MRGIKNNHTCVITTKAQITVFTSCVAWVGCAPGGVESRLVAWFESTRACVCVCGDCSPGSTRFLCLRGLHTSRSGCAVVSPTALAHSPHMHAHTFTQAHNNLRPHARTQMQSRMRIPTPARACLEPLAHVTRCMHVPQTQKPADGFGLQVCERHHH